MSCGSRTGGAAGEARYDADPEWEEFAGSTAESAAADARLLEEPKSVDKREHEAIAARSDAAADALPSDRQPERCPAAERRLSRG